MPLYFARDEHDFLRLLTPPVDPNCGGHVCFMGTVRRVNRQKTVSKLHYEAYEALALKLFAEIERIAQQKFSILHSHAVHRVGDVSVGQGAVSISVSAEHRHGAFLGARFLIDELKFRIPIWKKEYYQDGTSSWDQGLCHCGGEIHHQEALAPVKRAMSASSFTQKKLFNAKVLLIGAGGLGCPLAINLAALGIKELHIFDADRVEEKNLARQFIFSLNHVGQEKAPLIRDFCAERFPWTTVTSHPRAMNHSLAQKIIGDFDLVIDGSDCLNTKAMVGDTARRAGVPFIAASVFQAEGEVSLISPGEGGCFCCFRSAHSQINNCTTTGVFTHACSLIAALATAKALAVLGQAAFVQSSVTIIDATGKTRELKVGRDPHCRRCQDNHTNVLRVIS